MHWPNGCLMIRLDWPTSTAPVCRKCGRNVLKLPVLLEFQQFLSFEKNAHRRLKNCILRLVFGMKERCYCIRFPLKASPCSLLCHGAHYLVFAALVQQTLQPTRRPPQLGPQVALQAGSWTMA